MDNAAFQEKIGRLEGVEAARVVAENGHVDEIHVLARRNKTPKQLVRDVQSLSQALFGVAIDRRIVSVVQLADSDLDSGIRPALVDVSEAIEGARAEVTVTLKWHDNLLIGSAAGLVYVTEELSQKASIFMVLDAALQDFSLLEATQLGLETRAFDSWLPLFLPAGAPERS